MSVKNAKQKSKTKKRKSTILSQLLGHCKVLKDGTYSHLGFCAAPPGSKFCVPLVIQPKQNKKTRSGKKYDAEKPKIALIPPSSIIEQAKGMTYGAIKYGSYNWTKGIEVSRLISAALRHILQFLSGEDLDKESGVSHLGHALCNLGMCIEMLQIHPELDDRAKKENK